MKVYIAGPGVFSEDAAGIRKRAIQTLEGMGLTPMHPFDNEVRADIAPTEKARLIFISNVAMIDQCDAVIADISPFRGPSADVGTVWEIGYALGQGKPVVAYTANMTEYETRAKGNAQYPIVEDFGEVDNLMITRSVDSIHNTFDEAATRLAFLASRRD